MKKFLIALAFLPLAAGIASAGEALTDQQMDRVTAGGALAFANAFAIGPFFTLASTGTVAVSGFFFSFSASHSLSVSF